jgi:hypothetical protein
LLKAIIDVGASAQGIQDLNKWLEGTASFFDEGKRGAQQFAESILTFLQAAAPAMKQFGADFADVEEDWNKLIQHAAETGEITKAVTGAGEAFKGFMEMVARAVDVMMKLSADVGPDVGRMFKSIGDALEAIEPPLSMFIKGFTMGIEVIAKIVQAAEGLAEPFSVISGLLAALAIGFKVFEWVIAPITQTIKLFKLLGEAITDTAGLRILWAKFTDALGLTEGAAEKLTKATTTTAASLKEEGDVAEKAAAKNELFQKSLKAKEESALKAAAAIDAAAKSIKAEGDTAEAAAAKNEALAASAEEAGAGSAAAGEKVAGAGVAAAGAAEGTAAGAAGMAELGEAGAAGAAGAGGLAAALDVLSGPVGWTITAVAALAVGAVALAKNWDTVGPAVSRAVDTGKQALSSYSETEKQSVAQSIQAWQDLPAKIGGFMGTLAADMVKYGKLQIDQFVGALKQGSDNIKAFFHDTVPQIIKEAATPWPQLLQQAGKSMMDGLQAAVKAGGDGVRQYFQSQFPPQVKQAFQNAGDWLKDSGANIMKGLMDGIKGLMDSFVEMAVDLGKSFIDKFNQTMGIQSPSKAMEDAGKSIVDGLVQGVKEGASSAIQAVVDVATQMLAAAKQALGIASPSMVFSAEVGSMISAGVAHGVIADARLVTDAVRQLGLAAVAAGASALPAAGAVGVGAVAATAVAGSAGGSGPLQVTLQVQGNDSATAALIQGMFRRGQIKISANNIVRGRAYT